MTAAQTPTDQILDSIRALFAAQAPPKGRGAEGEVPIRLGHHARTGEDGAEGLRRGSRPCGGPPHASDETDRQVLGPAPAGPSMTTRWSPRARPSVGRGTPPPNGHSTVPGAARGSGTGLSTCSGRERPAPGARSLANPSSQPRRRPPRRARGRPPGHPRSAQGERALRHGEHLGLRWRGLGCSRAPCCTCGTITTSEE